MSVATEFAPAVTIPAAARPCWPAESSPVEVPQRLASVSVLHAPSERPANPPVRLTRRGVVALALAVAALGLGLVWLAKASSPHSAGAPAAPGAVTVRSGDTLWSIATRVAPQRDPRAEVAALQSRNHLRSVDLVPGQVLRVP
jgi:nucleoid-associated protein YgaU